MNKSQELEIMVLRAKMKADDTQENHDEAWYGASGEELLVDRNEVPEVENGDTPTGI